MCADCTRPIGSATPRPRRSPYLESHHSRPDDAGHESRAAVRQTPTDDRKEADRIVAEIAAGEPAGWPGSATKALRSVWRGKPVAGRPQPAVVRAPEYWSWPVGALWAATVAA